MLLIVVVAGYHVIVFFAYQFGRLIKFLLRWYNRSRSDAGALNSVLNSKSHVMFRRFMNEKDDIEYELDDEPELSSPSAASEAAGPSASPPRVFAHGDETYLDISSPPARLFTVLGKKRGSTYTYVTEIRKASEKEKVDSQKNQKYQDAKHKTGAQTRANSETNAKGDRRFKADKKGPVEAKVKFELEEEVIKDKPSGTKRRLLPLKSVVKRINDLKKGQTKEPQESRRNQYRYWRIQQSSSSETPPIVKGKFGPNTKRKGKRVADLKTSERNVGSPVDEEIQELIELQTLSPQPVLRTRPSLHRQQSIYKSPTPTALRASSSADSAKKSPDLKKYENVVEKPQKDPDKNSVSPQHKRSLLHRQSTASTGTEIPRTSTDSYVITTETEVHFLSESSDRKQTTKKSTQSSLDSVKSLPDDGVDHPVHESSLSKRQYHKGITDIINPQIGYDILQSVPISSQEIKQTNKKTKDRPSVHWPRNVEVLQQKYAEIKLFNDNSPPPSPAPSTPVKPKKYSFFGPSTSTKPKKYSELSPSTSTSSKYQSASQAPEDLPEKTTKFQVKKVATSIRIKIEQGNGKVAHV
ncbi:uncharacterized protein LOC135087011 [Ostrinia nubilalis]|uniref:uncharacterized protein LOC135087011 n=1 Tax=Ostrinia nubilalis TaxID=29057 RepID=UPI0030823F4D